MKIIANYTQRWDDDGYVTTQNITVECTDIELKYINSRVHNHLEKEGNLMWYKRLCEGEQRITLTPLKAFKETICKENKRIKGDRNSFIKVVITKRHKPLQEGECVTCEHATPDLGYCTLHQLSIYKDGMGCDQWKKSKPCTLLRTNC